MKKTTDDRPKTIGRFRIFVFLICIFGLWSTVHGLSQNCLADDIRFDVTVDKRKVSLGDTIGLSLNFYGTQSISRPDLPDIHGFDWRYLGPSTRMSITNGKVTTSITHMYTLIPMEVGEFTVPPLSILYRGKTYSSDPIEVEVVKGAFADPKSLSEAPYRDKVHSIKERIFLTMQVGKTSAYVNEIIPVTIKLYVNNLVVRDIQYPSFAHAGFSAEKLSEPRQYREVLGGVLHEVLEFNTFVFGMRPGEMMLGPAEIKCTVLLKRESQRRRRSSIFDDDFFDGFFRDSYEKFSISLESVDNPVRIIELPADGAPEDFDGALGDYQFRLEASPKDVKVGDPITLRMSITGEGNFSTVKAPDLEFTDDFKVYEPEIKEDQTGKVFEQVIIPKSENVTEIPRVDFSFFDTAAGKYRTITRGPIPINVKPLPRGEELEIFETPAGVARAVRRRETLGRDIIYIKDMPGAFRLQGVFLYNNKLFVIMQFIPFLAVIAVFVIERRRTRLLTDVRYARRLRAPRAARKNLRRIRGLLDSGEPAGFFNAVFKALQEYLGDKFHLPTGSITSSVTEDLAGKNIDKEILDKLGECFNNCDMARYAPSSLTKDDMSRTFALLQEIIDGLERIRL